MFTLVPSSDADMVMEPFLDSRSGKRVMGENENGSSSPSINSITKRKRNAYTAMLRYAPIRRERGGRSPVKAPPVLGLFTSPKARRPPPDAVTGAVYVAMMRRETVTKTIAYKKIAPAGRKLVR